MRATVLRWYAAGVVVCATAGVPAHDAATTPADADGAVPQAEAMQDRWQGRHNYLYDDDYQPGSETVGQRPADARACVDQPVRLRRTDGSTVVRRFRRCD
jgi:hypothetical protein